MHTIKQFTIFIFFVSFLFGLCFDVLNRDMTNEWISSTTSVEEVQDAITNVLSSTFAIDGDLSTAAIR